MYHQSSSPPAAAAQGEVKTVPTKPYEGQKAGTSGLRKKTDVFMQKNYLANWVQALFLALKDLGDEVKGTTWGLGGDGRYFNKEAVQIILKICAGAPRDSCTCFERV
jgi:phosphoglucomutase